MKVRKITASLLLLAILSAPLLSCGDSSNQNVTTTTQNAVAGVPDGENETQSGGETSGNSSGSIEERPDYPELPVQNLGGYNFRVISRSQTSNSHWWNLDIAAEEENGDQINDAVYRRNRAIEEKYNVTISNFSTEDIAAKVRTSVRAGSDDYDLVVIGLNGGLEALSQDGMLHDLKQMPYVNLEKPWWDQLAVEQLSITNRLFAMSSDLTIRDKDATIILMFSKTLAKNHALEDLYSLVQNGTWTFAKMFEMMKTVSTDLNSDGVIDDEDQVGLLTQRAHGIMLFNAAAESTTRLNAENVPELTIYNPRALEVTDKIREIQGDKNFSLNADEYGSKYADVWDGLQIPMFAENRALFYHAGMNRVTLLRTMDSDFGIIPPPKYDESQERYHVSVDPWCTSGVGIPITVPSTETTGLILEALTFESRYVLLPVYYDINLKTKFARDNESKEMIDIILTNRFYDLGNIYRWANITDIFGNLAIGQNTSLTTFYERNEARIRTAIDRTINKFESIG